ncbi:tRNA (adenosine(37)-N6)-dimethylallyltransferase MiaA [Candidatus Uhrbacteria bacterium]|nr:tRNA (adenosine(37)-N6)-dimethylallyltransferase MiaA [Candidatus Uhrbacteria bacterium]
MGKGKPKIVVVAGPTASGKTDLGVFLAKKFHGEVVNADSRQIYREMDIGTAKPVFSHQPSAISLQGVRHHLFDLARPDKIVTVAEWKRRAVGAIRQILRRKKLPMVVGGTGLYVQALVENLNIPAVPPNPQLRARLEKELKKRGLISLYQKLLKLDPQAIGLVQPNNPRRIIRALEVCLTTRQPFTSQRRKGKPLFEVLEIGLTLPRNKLYRRIDQRVDQQMKQGWVEETKKLLKKYRRALPAMSGIGYGEIAEYLDILSLIRANGSIREKQKILLDETAQKIEYHTHDYARRQLAWFRRDKEIHWVKTKKQAALLVKEFLG